MARSDRPSSMTDDEFVAWFAEQTMESAIPHEVTPRLVVERLVAIGVMDEPDGNEMVTVVMENAIEASRRYRDRQ